MYLIEILDPEIQMKLLWIGGIRPPRWLVVQRSLKCQHETGFTVKCRPIVVQRPPAIRLIDRATEDLPIESGELERFRTIQHNALKTRDHVSPRMDRSTIGKNQDTDPRSRWSLAGVSVPSTGV